MKTKEAIKILAEQLKNDKVYRDLWASNIAMCYNDSYISYRNSTGKMIMNTWDRNMIANQAAEYFLKLLCDEIKVPEGR